MTLVNLGWLRQSARPWVEDGQVFTLIRFSGCTCKVRPNGGSFPHRISQAASFLAVLLPIHHLALSALSPVKWSSYLSNFGFAFSCHRPDRLRSHVLLPSLFRCARVPPAATAAATVSSSKLQFPAPISVRLLNFLLTSLPTSLEFQSPLLDHYPNHRLDLKQY
jgi:hypothetical protein